MKKKLTILGLASLLLVAVIVPSAFAADNDTGSATIEKSVTDEVYRDYPNYPYSQEWQNQQNPWFNQMFDWHDSWIDQAEDNNQIPPQAADAWRNHFDYMRDFHNQVGYGMMGMMGGMMGGYGPYGYGPYGNESGNNNTNYYNNYGYGMMGGGYGMGYGMGGYPQQ